MNKEIFQQTADKINLGSHQNGLLHRINVFPSRIIKGDQGRVRVLGFIEHATPELYSTSVLLELPHEETLEGLPEERGRGDC